MPKIAPVSRLNAEKMTIKVENPVCVYSPYASEVYDHDKDDKGIITAEI